MEQKSLNEFEELEKHLDVLQSYVKVEITKIDAILFEMGNSDEILLPEEVEDVEGTKFPLRSFSKYSIRSKRDNLVSTTAALVKLREDFGNNLEEIKAYVEILQKSITASSKLIFGNKHGQGASKSTSVFDLALEQRQLDYLNDVSDWINFSNKAVNSKEKEFAVDQAKAAMERIDGSRLSWENKSIYLHLREILYSKGE